MRQIVIIGGGTGTYTLLLGLKKYPAHLSVIVSTADDGGSTGILRKKFGVMPPGDIRQCLTGLSRATKELKDLFAFRYSTGFLKGHPFGNLYLAGLELEKGSIERAIYEAKKLLKVKGEILPVTLKPTTLSAVYENGRKIIGEHNIDDQNPKGKTLAIKSLKLSAAKANPKALKAIAQADVIIFGPGDLYTSILPNILVKGLKEAINKSSAKKVLVSNIMTKFGQTDGFKVSNFVKELEKYLGEKVDVVLANNKKPNADVIKKYAAEKAKFVEPDLKSGKNLEVVSEDFISKEVPQQASGDKLKRSMLRHDCDKVAKVIWRLI